MGKPGATPTRHTFARRLLRALHEDDARRASSPAGDSASPVDRMVVAMDPFGSCASMPCYRGAVRTEWLDERQAAEA